MSENLPAVVEPSGISLKRLAATSHTQFKYSIGADPELFVIDNHGKFRSAHDLVPGHKLAPEPVSKGAIQPDGTAAEFNIHQAVSVEEFTENIRSVLKDLQTTINATDNSLRLRVTPVAFFDPKYFATLPPEALAFGCTPDYDAWTGEVKEFKPTNRPMRTGAGHIHVGWTEFEDPTDSAHFFDCMEATKQLDSVLYFMSLLWDKDKDRRTLYGRIGSFRPKKYGVEYRPLSNAWVADPDLHRWVFQATTKAMELLDSKDYTRLWMDKEIHELIQAAQNDANIVKMELLDLHNRFVQDFDFPSLPKAYLA